MKSPDILHRTRDTAVLLRSGLNLIQQALSIYSVDLKLIFANRQFKSMFDLPEHLVEAGADFGETLTYLAEHGEYGAVEDVPAFVAERVQQALAFEQHYVERQRSQGRWLSIEGGPLRQGGWVAVYTDITEVKRQEAMLRSRSNELSEELLDRSEELTRTNRALEATINRLHETQQHLEAAEARIRLAAETTPAHIARLNREERYTYSNQRLPLRAAHGDDDLIGFTAREVLGDAIYQTIFPALQSALNGEPKVVEFIDPATGRQIRAAFTPDSNAADVVTGVYVLSMDTTVSEPNPPKDDPSNSQTAQFLGWTARLAALELMSDGQTVPLTVAEAALLRIFLASPNRVLSRDALFAAPGVKVASDRALDVRISRLRHKLKDNAKEPRLLRTIYGAGYIFTCDVEWLD